MLTISQLATYAGVTVRAIRHYHKIGLLPEPERNHSGYRAYDAAAVVRLIRIRTLAHAGVPLARVQELLDASPEEFALGVQEIDRELRAEIRRLQRNRERIARLAAGEHLALPQSVVDYLDRLRGLGMDERYIELEGESWIMVAAQVPDQIEAIIARKHDDLNNPDMVQLYRLFNQALDWTPEDPRITEIVDILERQMQQALESGDIGVDGFDDPFVDLLDQTAASSSPIVSRILDMLEERGWKGWTRIERVPAASAETVTGRLH